MRMNEIMMKGVEDRHWQVSADEVYMWILMSQFHFLSISRHRLFQPHDQLEDLYRFLYAPRTRAARRRQKCSASN